MDINNYLRELGLSAYETKIISTLLSKNRLKAKEISNRSGVPYGRVYDILESLVQKHIITITPKIPKLYSIVSKDILISRLIDPQKEKLEAMKNLGIDLVQEIPNQEMLGELVDDRLSVYLGASIWYRLTKELCKNAKKEFFASLFLGAPEVYYKVADPEIRTKIKKDANKAFNVTVLYPYKQMLARGVKAKLLLQNFDEHALSRAKELNLKGSELRYRNVPGMRVVIRDREEVLLAIYDPDRKLKRLTLHIKEKYFAKAMTELFLDNWKKANPVELRKKK